MFHLVSTRHGKSTQPYLLSESPFKQWPTILQRHQALLQTQNRHYPQQANAIQSPLERPYLVEKGMMQLYYHLHLGDTDDSPFLQSLFLL